MRATLVTFSMTVVRFAANQIERKRIVTFCTTRVRSGVAAPRRRTGTDGVFQAGGPGNPDQLDDRDDQQHGSQPDQRVAPAQHREMAADADEEQHGGEEDRKAHVLVSGVEAAPWPSLDFSVACAFRSAACASWGILYCGM